MQRSPPHGYERKVWVKFPQGDILKEVGMSFDTKSLSILIKDIIKKPIEFDFLHDYATAGFRLRMWRRCKLRGQITLMVFVIPYRQAGNISSFMNEIKKCQDKFINYKYPKISFKQFKKTFKKKRGMERMVSRINEVKRQINRGQNDIYQWCCS